MTASDGPRRRPRLAVYKLASCDGCQLTLLDCEEHLLAVAERLEIAYFAEAATRPDDGGPYDLVLVEGSISAPFQVEEVRAIRAKARHLVAIGACATAGGVQALRNFADADAYRRVVYARPEYVASLDRVTPVSAHVPVDYELRGCPVDRRQLLEVITAFLVGRRPQLADESVCMECKRAGHVCVTVARGEACLGPVTHAGCGALCPGFLRGCYGCFGPTAGANTGALAASLAASGVPEDDVRRRFHQLHAAAPEHAAFAPTRRDRGDG